MFTSKSRRFSTYLTKLAALKVDIHGKIIAFFIALYDFSSFHETFFPSEYSEYGVENLNLKKKFRNWEYKEI